jgi:hypothetical protein
MHQTLQPRVCVCIYTYTMYVHGHATDTAATYYVIVFDTRTRFCDMFRYINGLDSNVTLRGLESDVPFIQTFLDSFATTVITPGMLALVLLLLQQS